MRPPRRSGALVFESEREYPPEVVDSTIALYLTWRRWIRRRTDRLSFIDLTTVRRTTIWEFELPDGLPHLRDSDLCLVPIGLFTPEKTLRNVCLTDPRGAAYLLTSAETERLAQEMLARAAQVDPAARKPGLAGSVHGLELGAAHPERLHMTDSELIQSLGHADYPDVLSLRVLAAELRLSYLQVAAITLGNSRRRSLTLEYEERLMMPDELGAGESGADGGNRLIAARLGSCAAAYHQAVLESGGDRNTRSLRQRLLGHDSEKLHVVWPLWCAGDTESTHVEIEAPPPLEVEDAYGAWWSARLGGWRLAASSDLGPRGHLLLNRRLAAVSLDKGEPRSAEPGPEDSERGTAAFVSIILRPRSEMAAATNVIGFGSIGLMLLATLALLVDPGANRQTLATVIAFVSSLATTFFTRPQGHEIEGQLLRGTRLRLGVVGLAVPGGIGAVLLALMVNRWFLIGGLVLLSVVNLLLTLGMQAERETRPFSSRFGDRARTLAEAIRALPGDHWRIVDCAEGRRLPISRPSGSLPTDRDPGDPRLRRGEPPITDEALVEVAREYADRAGWRLDQEPAGRNNTRSMDGS
jgi:hypothetical protein